MLNKEIVSEIINDLRALQIDDRISERYVLSKLRDFLGIFLRRENDQLRLYYYDYIWTTIDCLEMEEVSTTECLSTTNCKITKLTKSILPIPELYSYKNGPLVKEVFSVDEGVVYQPSTQMDFNKILKREFNNNFKYYWFRNGHLYIPNGPDVVLFTGCFKIQSDALKLCSCNKIECIEIMEDEFPCPAHLLSTVKQETVKDLYNFYKRSIVDSVGDNDPNNKTTRPTNAQ